MFEGVDSFPPKSRDIFNLYFELAKLKLSDVLLRFEADVILLIKGAIAYFLLTSV